MFFRDYLANYQTPGTNHSRKASDSIPWLLFPVLFLIGTVATPQTVTTVYSFAGPDGSTPNAGLTMGADNNLYGTTFSGGAVNQSGTIFEITNAGALTSIYSFSGPDGSSPHGALALGSDGNFYGSTYSGGANNLGTVFKITPAGILTTLHSFIGTDGAYPLAGLTAGANGDFYGSTVGGGASGNGTIFTIDSGGTLTTIYNFSGVDGSAPYAALTPGSDGNFYGATESGGANSYYGTLFRITPAGALTTIYSFAFTDGSSPYASLTAANGLFYGTASNGGADTQYGTVFSVTSTGALTSLHNFSGPDGSVPGAALTVNSNGIFYGTSIGGGANYQYGTVFQLTPGGTLTTLHSFHGTDGANPTGSLSFGSDGNLYGTTSGGGLNGYGTVFRLPTCSSCTATSLISSANPSIDGTAVTLTAEVTAVAGGGTPNGTVVFKDGSSRLGSATLAGGTASVTSSAFTQGAQTVSATYLGNKSFQPSSGTLTQQVNSSEDAIRAASSLHEHDRDGQANATSER